VLPFPRLSWGPLPACAAGVLIGAMYTLSPTTAWSGLAIAAIIAWAAHGVTGRERVWVAGILFLAVGLRLLALVLFFFVADRFDSSFPTMIPDEWYIFRRSALLSNIALGIPVAPIDYTEVTLPYAESSLMYAIAYGQMQLGPAPYGIRLLNVTLYLAACVTLYRTIRPAFGSTAALGGLVLALFMPSLFIWSISMLKEPLYLFLAAASVAAATAVLRASTMSGRLLALIVCVSAILATETVRTGGSILIGGGILAGVLMAIWIRRPVLLLTTLMLCTVLGSLALQSPRVQERATGLLHAAVRIHMGHVGSPGWTYRLLEPELYAGAGEAQLGDPENFGLTSAPMARYALRAVASFVLVPLPWKVESPFALAYLAEHVVWLVLVVLATIGAIAGIRRDASLALILLAVIALSAAAIAFTSGNVGTLVRHRGMVLMPLGWFGSLGACTLVDWLMTGGQVGEHHPAHGPVGV